MLKISTKGRYAIEALLYIAAYSKGEAINIKQIKEGTSISEKYLEQIFFLLRKDKILDTIRGPKGGYRILPHLEELTVGRVLRAVEGDIVPVLCVKDPESCTSSIKDNCSTKGLWKTISGVIEGMVDSLTLEELKDGFLSCTNEMQELDCRKV